MAITGSTDLGNGVLCLTVDAEPTTTAVDAPAGSLIIFNGEFSRKVTSGLNTDVKGIVDKGGLTPGSILFADAGGVRSQDNPNLFWDNTAKRLGLGTSSPNAPLDIRANSPGSVGGFPSGALHVTSPSASVNANAVITGHNLFGGNKQLWYLGSSSGSNDNVTFINRQNGSVSFGTNSITRLTILSSGEVGIGISPVVSALLELASTSKGFLPPRMTTTQRDAITSPATGLQVFNTTNVVLEEFDGTVWRAVGGLKVATVTIQEPDLAVRTDIPIMPIEAKQFPSGIVVEKVQIKTSVAGVYSVLFRDYDDAVDVTGIAIATVATGAAEDEKDSGAISVNVAAGRTLGVRLPATDIGLVVCTFFYRAA